MERTLLLVDDEENIVSALVRLLRRDGYNILRATSGREGLELLAQNQVGVIVSDQRMPEMTGVEFLSKVRELYPDTVRMVLSGYTDLNSVTDAINRGAIYKFLTKPWEDELLRANIDEAFRHYEMKMENIRLTRQIKQANEELSNMNLGLEQRVEEKTREIVRNLNMLRISQEVLDHLPVGVIGIAEDGVIAIANRIAHDLLNRGDEVPLIGEMAADCIPAELLAGVSRKECLKSAKKTCHAADGRDFHYWCYSMGELSQSQGMVLVIDPDAKG